MYRHVEYYPGDPILSLVETFKRDERPEKVNLSIGIYFDDEGKMPVWNLSAGQKQSVRPYRAHRLICRWKVWILIEARFSVCCLARIIRHWQKGALRPYRLWAARGR